MTYNPAGSSADESEGKYSSDEPITFEHLLEKQTEADRDPFKFQRDETPEHAAVATDNEPQQQNAATTTETDSSDCTRLSEQQRKRLSTSILKTDLRGQADVEYATGTTSHSVPREYALRRLPVDDTDYFYIVGTRNETTLAGQAWIVDFGSEITFEPPTVDRECLHDAIEEQRVDDFHHPREPVQRLRSEQLDALEAAYQNLVERRASEAKEGAEQRYRDPAPLEVYDQFVVVNDAAERVRDEVLTETLLPRQAETVAKTFAHAITFSATVPGWVWGESITTPLPLVAYIELSTH